MADALEPKETVSREAHDRMTQERDQFKTEAQQGKAAAAQTLIVDKAYEHLKGKVPDAYTAAKALSRDTRFADVKPEDLTTRMDEWLGEWKSIFGSDPITPAPVDPNAPQPPEAPTGPVAPPPGAARPAPSPANPGGAPTLEPLTFTSPEVQRLVKAGDRAGLQELIKAGRYQPQPGNPYAGRPAPS